MAVTEADIGKEVHTAWGRGVVAAVSGNMARIVQGDITHVLQAAGCYVVAPPDPVSVEPVETRNTYFDKKYDQGKSRVGLIPAASLIEVGHVMAYGCVKYAEDSWQTVPEGKKRYLDALLRHTLAIMDGELRDPETNRLHAAHAACNALFLTWLHLKEKL